MLAPHWDLRPHTAVRGRCEAAEVGSEEVEEREEEDASDDSEDEDADNASDERELDGETFTGARRERYNFSLGAFCRMAAMSADDETTGLGARDLRFETTSVQPASGLSSLSLSLSSSALTATQIKRVSHDGMGNDNSGDVPVSGTTTDRDSTACSTKSAEVGAVTSTGTGTTRTSSGEGGSALSIVSEGIRTPEE